MDSLNKLIIQLTDEVSEEYTGHSNKLGELTYRLARQVKNDYPELDLDDHFADNMKTASKLHDFGKKHIPSDILNKPSKLTLQEYKKVKQHPVSGFMELTNRTSKMRLDKKDKKLLSICKEVILLHHERMDGSGYPMGLDKNIPLSAQIMAVSDSFDAMTTDRAYHKNISAEKALEILKKDKEKYNPIILESLEKVVSNYLVN